MIPDFISKRIFESRNVKPKVMDQVHMALNVGTIYARPYKYLGWNGMIIIYIYLCIFVLFLIRSIKSNSNYSVSLIATLNTLMLFSMFDNMIWFSGLSLQLVYPVLLSFGMRI
jgi:hypothetical protein